MRHLRVVDAIESAGSVTRAAAVLGLSQPALTTQVRRIEQVLGGPLFDRGPHGVVLTVLGEVLLPHIRSVLRAQHRLQGAVHRFHEAPHLGVLRVGAFPTALAARFCEVVTEVAAGRLVDLVVVDGRQAAVDAVRNGDAELVLHADYPGHELAPPPGVRMLEVGVEPVFVVVPARHPAAARGEADLAELGSATWLLSISGDDEFDRHLADRCEQAGIGPVPVRALDRLVSSQAIRRGDDVVAPVQALDTGVEYPGVVVTLRGTPLRIRHLLLWRDGGAAGEQRARCVRDGLVRAYVELARTSSRVPGWQERNPGWLGHPG